MTEPVYCQLCGTTEKVEIVFGLSGGDSMLKVCPDCKKICQADFDKYRSEAKLPSSNPNPYTKKHISKTCMHDHEGLLNVCSTVGCECECHEN